jgi:cytidyltransferase-like protein
MRSIPIDASTLKSMLPPNASFCLIGGYFDLIHVGHLHLLEYAATLEDLLVVAVLSDRYMSTNKNPERPIISESHRAKMVSAIRCVDYVYIADESPNSEQTLSLLQPNSVVFGDEKGAEARIERRIARIKIYSPNTKVKLLSRYDAEEVSTSQIIHKIQKDLG